VIVFHGTGKLNFFAAEQNVDRRADTLGGAAKTAKWVMTYHAKGSAPHASRLEACLQNVSSPFHSERNEAPNEIEKYVL
jgi:hypothetical protein